MTERDRQQRLPEYLSHIFQAIDRIQRYTARTAEAEFLGNELVQDGVIRNLEVIGEACHNIELNCPVFAAAHPELPLAVAYQMRNAVAHGYFKVDLGIVWRTIHVDLAPLKARVAELLAAARQADEGA